ncbi:MAG: HDIG domain-containing protein [Pseudonocardia sp.]|nr:HDIG domain-containing protein [Pseudonocardia sp.]
MRAVPTVNEAHHVAEGLLAPLGDRWRHTQAVAARAVELSSAVAPDERTLLVVAAWWHDLGYAPEIRVTGMHQIDGAQYLTSMGYPSRLCALVAHHSAATFEAEERGLSEELAAWPHEEGAVADALWTADMTTGPAGEAISYPVRLDEILRRYESGTAVARAMTRARPSIEAAIARTATRLAN